MSVREFLRWWCGPMTTNATHSDYGPSEMQRCSVMPEFRAHDLSRKVEISHDITSATLVRHDTRRDREFEVNPAADQLPLQGNLYPSASYYRRMTTKYSSMQQRVHNTAQYRSSTVLSKGGRYHIRSVRRMLAGSWSEKEPTRMSTSLQSPASCENFEGRQK